MLQNYSSSSFFPTHHPIWVPKSHQMYCASSSLFQGGSWQHPEVLKGDMGMKGPGRVLTVDHESGPSNCSRFSSVGLLLKCLIIGKHHRPLLLGQLEIIQSSWTLTCSSTITINAIHLIRVLIWSALVTCYQIPCWNGGPVDGQHWFRILVHPTQE